MKRSGFKRPEPCIEGAARTSVPVFKPKTCSKHRGGCGERFTPTRQMQAACSPACAQAFAEKAREKKAREMQKVERREHREKLEATRSLAWWAGKAQDEVNRYVRLRDAGKPCISCGTTMAEEWHAGHYLSRGARPELRFHLDNIAKQCCQCNYFGGGLQAAYRANLVERIGLDRVLWLEGPHPPAKHTRETLQALRDEFKAKCKEFKA